MSLPVKLKDIVDALEEAGDFIMHFFDKRTGEVLMLTDEVWRAAEDDELISDYPEWQRGDILKAREIQSSAEHFAELPDQTEIHEYEIMEQFSRTYHDARTSAELLRSIKGKGAFRRFKDTIFDLGIQDEWNAYRANEFEKIAVDWLEQENIPYTSEGEIESSSAGAS